MAGQGLLFVKAQAWKEILRLKMLTSCFKIIELEKIHQTEIEFMKKLIICITSITFFIFPLVSICDAQKQATPIEDGKALFEKKCGSCHGIKKATGQKKNKTEWADTVMRMKNKNGAPVNDDEAKIIIDYLGKNYGK